MTIRVWLFVVCSCGFVAQSAAQDGSTIKQLEQAVQQAIALAEPAVACIMVSRSDFDSDRPDGVPEYFGSGVVIDHRLVLTCYHVVRDAKAISIRLPSLGGRKSSGNGSRAGRAEIIAADNRSDLAVLRLDRDIETPPIQFGAGEDLQKGSFIVGISHAYAAGFRDGSPTASWGIVSNLRRRLPGSPRETDRPRTLQQCATLIQTDAKIQLGGSGGAIVDLNGNLVALATAQAALTGNEVTGGYALPIDAGVRRIIDRLKKGEEVEYGFLGVSSAFDRGFPRRPNRAGAFIESVTPNSPADRAGIRPGDSIIAIDGRPVRDFDDLFLLIGVGMAGREVTLQIQRGVGEVLNSRTILVKAANPDNGIATNRPTSVHGLRVDYTSVIATQGRQPMAEGVVVKEVAKNSPAEEAKLVELGDVITEVNGVRVSTPKEFYREAEKATSGKRPVRLRLAEPSRQVILQ